MRDNNGNTMRCSTDAYGNMTCRDSSGRTIRCSTDAYGNTTCR
jgi:YD repeat-containing protein